MITYTPGPWHFSDDGTIRSDIPALKKSNLMGDYRGAIIADIQYSVNQHDTEWGQPTSRAHAIPEAEANARLIAAAPDLLAELRSCAVSLGMYLAANGGREAVEKSPNLLRVQALIARIEGKV
jgi:hypothetical protein